MLKISDIAMYVPLTALRLNLPDISPTRQLETTAATTFSAEYAINLSMEISSEIPPEKAYAKIFDAGSISSGTVARA